MATQPKLSPVADPPVGTKLSASDAKAMVDALYNRMYERWDQKVTRGRFMTDLKQGGLPMEAIKLFWKNWSYFVFEVNNIAACSYQRQIGFLKRHPELLASLGAKIADELMHPRPPGHVAIVLDQGKAFGLSELDMTDCQMLPECRALLEWARGMLYEGTFAEWWSWLACEEPIGYWARDWKEALAKHYGFSSDKTKYFQTHEEADLEVHEGGLLGHGEVNRTGLQKVLEDGLFYMRPGYTLEYCAFTSVDYLAMFFDAPYKIVRGEYD